MNFSFLPNVSERISNNFGEYFNQIPIREATTGYHQPIPESLGMLNIFPNEAVIIIPLPEENKQMEVNVRAVKRKRDDGCPILAKPAPVSPNKQIRLSGPSGFANISLLLDIFPNGLMIIPSPEENNQQMEVDSNRCSLVKRKRDDNCPILLAKPAPLSRPNKRARLSDPDDDFVDIFKPMMFQPPRTGFPAAPSSTMKLPYWPALVTSIRPAYCGQFDVEMLQDINPITPNHPTRKMLHIKRRCFTSSIAGGIKVEMTKVTPMEVDPIVGSSKNWRKNRNRRKNKKDRANRIRELAIDTLLRSSIRSAYNQNLI